MSYNQCRLCTSHQQTGLIKYSVRHYAHAECALAKWGAGFLDKLTDWQCGQLPWFTLKKHGLLEQARRRYAIYEEAQEKGQ